MKVISYAEKLRVSFKMQLNSKYMNAIIRYSDER